MSKFKRGDAVAVMQEAPSSLSVSRSTVKLGHILYRWGTAWNPASDYWAVEYPSGQIVVASESMFAQAEE